MRALLTLLRQITIEGIAEAGSVAFNDSVTIERAPVERFIDIFEHSNETIKKLAVKSSYVKRTWFTTCSSLQIVYLCQLLIKRTKAIRSNGALKWMTHLPKSA
jgi:hypothetical protein